MSKRNLIAFAIVFCVFCAVIAQVPAQAPITCGELQLIVQTTVGNEDPAVYRNHGKYVSAVANIVDPYLESGEIDSVCASCIVNQFARSIPVEEQEPCDL
ncbi:MAG: hypothetical protein JSV10_08070 [Candidatus Zixiibacteriota bacterium]|nr:MAG: hypothetical protein JSV10_08070 [candidate division Zixibacteria bacterium]